MTVVKCPACQDEVTLPATFHPNARVQCPLCLESFVLGDLLERLPPRLIVLEAGDLPPGDGGGASGATWPSFGAGGGATAVASPFAAPKTLAPTTRPDGAPAATLAARPRAKKPEPNVVLEMAKIVGGGAVGVALSILILWWGVGTDPFKLAPTVSRFAPFLVPAKFRPATDDAVPAEEGGDDEPAELIFEPAGASTAPAPEPEAPAEPADDVELEFDAGGEPSPIRSQPFK